MRIILGGNTTRDYRKRVPNRIRVARDGALKPVQDRESGTLWFRGLTMKGKLTQCVAVILLLLILLTDCVAGNLKSISTEMEFNQYLNTYYLSPQPDLLVPAIKYMVSNQILSKYKHTELSMLAFFSKIIADNPSSVGGWRKEIGNESQDTQAVFIKLLETQPEWFISKALNGIERNDVCWTLFFASGDEKYVLKIIEQLQYLDERKDMERYLAAASARWSLSSNARIHSQVKTILQAVAKSADPGLRDNVKDILMKNPKEISDETVAVMREQRRKGLWQ
jgi:hypothetical protein